MYDDQTRVEIGIDFDHFQPDEIAHALTDMFQEAVDTRWTRSGTGAHELTADGTDERAAPHPESDPH